MGRPGTAMTKRDSKNRNRPGKSPRVVTSPTAAGEGSWRWADWIAYNATVFVAASGIMTVEILSTRLAARHLGSSIYTWT